MNNETSRRARRVLTSILRQSVALKIVFVCLCLFAAQRTGRAQAGGRDASFGADGRVTTDFNAAANSANAVALQPDGRIVVAGFSFSTATNSNDFAAMRYNADGTLDTSFGTGGLATFDFAGRDDVAYAVRLQPDGKIVLAGRTRNSAASQSDFAYARLRPDGIPEGGSDGSATADFGGDDEARALTIQANNRILLAGFTSTAAGTDFALARYDFRAAPDATFGTNGRVVTDFAAGDDRAFAVRLQPDGKIIAAGQTGGGGGGLDFAAARYNPDGTLDQTFAPGGPDGDGRSTISFGPAPDAARAVDLQTDGRIILAGFTGTGVASDFALVRLDTNGFADVSFGTDGYVTTDFDAGEDAANGVAIQPDGRIVAAGSTPAGFAAARYNIDGTSDMTFDGDGRATIAFAGGGSAARGVVLQPNGRIVLVGSVVGGGVSGASDVAVARIHAGATFVVNSVTDTVDPDDGATTLREAIDAANSNAETTLDTIQFDIDPLNPNPANPNAPPCPELTILGTPSRVCRITPTTGALPALTQPSIIDGYSQPGARPNEHTLAGANGGGTKQARILLELSGINGPDDGLTLTGGSVVRGLSIFGFRGNGVVLGTQGQSTNEPDYPGNRVEGCYFGIRPDGSYAGVMRNFESSILVFGSDYSVIGTNLDASLDQAERNVISNSTTGVLFRDVNETEFGEDTRFNRVQGNLIGTDSGGTVAVPNINGVVFASRGLTSNNVVGNFYKEAANVISGNTSAGVRIAAEANSLGNYTGTPSANEVRGNVIGLAGGLEARELFESGLDAPNLPLFPLPNGGHGIHLLGADGTVVGTNLEGATSGNIIQFNGGDGVRVETVLLFPAEEGQTAGMNNSILGNRIDHNDGLGIDLAPGGVTENDGDDPSTVDVIDPDADTGANNLQNFPVITSAVTTGGTTTILGTLESVPAQTYVVEFYSCGKCDPNAIDTTVGTHGEGQVPFGATTVTTDDEGHAAFTFVPASPVNVGRVINATASLITSDAPTFETSEFSSCAQVTEDASPTPTPTPTPTPSPTPTPTPSADLSIEKTASVNPAEVGRIFTYNITVSNAGPDAANAVTVTDSLPSSVTFTSATPTQGSCALASGTLTCQLGTIAANGSASIALQVKPRQTGTLMNTASVTAAESDPNASNNSATSTINVIKTADLKVAKSDSPDPIFVGEQTTYTLLVTNLGPLNGATGVVLTDSLPSSMTFVSATTTQGSLVTPPVGSTGTVTANIGSLAVNAQATVLITVRAAQSGAIVNTATVSSNETDTNTANNTATQTTTVKAAALQKLLMAKQVLTGGCENTTGNVYLTGPAPPGGLNVSLSSNVTGASVPASVFIPAGQSVSPAFSVTTSHVGAKQVGLVTATLGAGSVSRGLTINVGNGTCP